ncbi:MAG: FGGY-family carbohydrate kinase [Armatimonadota bacterium]
MPNVIGLDVGTQGTKGLLVTQEGRQLASAFRPSELHRPSPGVVEEDPEQQFAAVCEVIQECLVTSGADPSSIAGLAIAGQMAGVIGLGDDGRSVTPYDSWLDTRCSRYAAEMDSVAGEAIVRSAGCAPSFNHGPKILWWKNERPDAFRTIRSFVQPGGYAAMRLCGLTATDAFVDSTYLHFSGFADNAAGRWNLALCEQFGLDPDLLPRIVEPHAVVGAVTTDAAARSGLRAGTPVVAGCGDTAASFLACGATAEGICVDVAGTASVFAATTSSYRPDVAHRMLSCGRSATPGLWHSYAYINGGGMNLEWFRHEIANRGRSGPDRLDFDALEALAAQAPLENAPVFIPHLEGRVSPSEPGLTGGWLAVTRATTLGALYRSVLESVALEYAIYQQGIRSLYPDLRFRDLRITGGGEKSPLWNQIKADALGMTVAHVQGAGGAPLGAAMLACFGAGLTADLPTAAQQWIALGRRFDPDPELGPHYRRRLRQYESALKAARGFGRQE